MYYFFLLFLTHHANAVSDLKECNSVCSQGWTLDRLMEALFLNFFLSRSSSCCPRFLELISIVLILETLDLCLFFLNFKEAVNQR